MRLSDFFQLFKRALRGDAQQDFTQGSIGVAAFLLAVPMVLEMAMESIFAVVDIFYVSLLGVDAVAAVGLTEGVLTLLYAVAIGVSMAVTATIARRVGEGNVAAAKMVAAQTLWIGAAVALIVALIGWYFATDILRLMGATDAVLASGADYTLIMLCGAITILYLFLINGIFRGAGDASIAMRSLVLANGLNIVLDPIFIFGWWIVPEMGVAGAAVATTIGRGAGVIYQLYHLFSWGERIRLSWQDMQPQLATIGQLLRVSVGGVLQFLIATASWMVLVRIVATYGSAAVAGYTIAIRVVIFTILPAWGMSNAVATLVGQNLGAKQPERAERSVWVVAKYNLCFMLTVAAIFIWFAPEIIGLFSQQPEVITHGVSCLRFMAYGYGFYGIGMIVVQAFNGAGDTMTPSKINFFCYWLVQIPLAYWLAKQAELGTDGVFLAITVAESLLAVVGVWWFKKGQWKLKQL